MAVRCPGCGLEYDAGLFQFGRTIDCTCGARAGLDAQMPHIASGSPPRFLADAMLVGLARWLRMLGYDTACDPNAGDAALARRCYDEGRILLTRDRRLPSQWRLPQVLLVEADKPLAQVEEVAARFGLRLGAAVFTRCSRCNVRLEPVPAASAGADLPPGAPTGEPMHRCPECRRYYWEGSHVERMRRELMRRVARED
ncbi:MAG TPA: Mut7-C RNAse domain-containing protein [Candidatus Limnocylindrales bacterium]|nr:Mut7-C RNAse domain-containing protein [Candidatus Limnocylindrales bacterium]